LHLPAPDEREHGLEALDVVGRLAGCNVHRHRDLVQPQPGGIERGDPLLNLVEPDVADARVAQFL
jgi:hypothetical protein